ncbi:70f76fa4-52fb-420e-a197-e7cc39b9e563 [Sclerotinia trifoliorum]|uniref:phospholipase A2 n=1 Tax=Sclerotinia trifoliorum TaxID=28548 RepID=A0A8H2VR92_9HELO|nr:70f76fa4-52fb-420e-a197-e7cc39b9e563 [Sclerotinia trifoliorum]
MSAPQQLSLLSLDGGGIRGLSMLFIIEEIMNRINPDSPPKPCEYFDMIGGTSTGGLIAIMLGRLEMSVQECKEAYTEMMGKIFLKKHSRISLTKRKVRGQFDTIVLEEAIKAVIKDRGIPVDSLLFWPQGKCKIFVTSTTREGRGTRRLASYQSRGAGDLIKYTKIWEAARATSAAPSFFDPVVIGPYGEKFLDGGTGANNPVVELWNEAKDIWSSVTLEAQLRCLISIGTGVPKAEAFGEHPAEIFRTILAIATDTEKTAQDFHRRHNDLDKDNIYYRFNVQRGLETVGLNETKKLAIIASATRSYMAQQDVQNQLRICEERLQERIAGSVSPLPKRTEKDCLRTLFFEYGARQDAIELPDSVGEGRLEWILHDPNFQQWEARENLPRHQGVFSIEGHPGSGKSTMMKYLVTRFTSPEFKEESGRDEIVLAFYFNARSGNDLEKNTLGLFQSLLHQLLLETPPVPERIFKTFTQRNETGGDWTWKQNEIVEYFLQALEREHLKPVTIFIDALDECGIDGTTQEALRIIEIFQTAVTTAKKNGRILNLCVSSRHYPNIRFQHCSGVNVEENNKQDIGAFIESKLPSATKLSCEYSERQALKSDLVEKAGGIFLWVKLVMAKLKNMYAGGESISSLREELKRVPSDLHQLYKQLVESCQGDKGRGEMLQILQWALFSQTQLTAGELRHAMALACTATSVSPAKELVQTWQNETKHLTTNERFADMVRTRTKGLVEVIDEPLNSGSIDSHSSRCRSTSMTPESITFDYDSESSLENDWPRVLQQPHHGTPEASVHGGLRLGARRELQSSFWRQRIQVIHESVRNFFVKESGLLLLDPGLDSQLIGLSHNQLLDDSLKYLTLYQIGESISSPVASEDLASSVDLDALSVTSDELQPPFEEPPILLKYSANYLFVHACEADQHGVAQFNLFDRLYTSDDGALLKLIISLNKKQPLRLKQNYPWKTSAPNVVLALASYYKVESCLANLLDQNGGNSRQGADINALLGCDDLTLESNDLIFGAHLPLWSDAYTPLMFACIANHESVVKFLLRAKADVNIKSPRMEYTALHLAAFWGNKNICRMLLRCKANVQVLDVKEKSPLFYACGNQRSEVVIQLIKSGAAVQSTEEQNVILRFVFGRESYKSEWPILTKVFNNILDVNYQGVDEETPLSLAIQTGNANLVRLMLERGAELWAGTGFCSSPLYTACHNNALAWLVKIMMNNDWGAKYNWDKKDVAHGKTILHWAAEFDFIDLIQELIAAKASPHIHDFYGETPLHYAAETGHFKAVKLLVGAGASLTVTDFECRNFRTPRDCATQNGHYTIVDYLSKLMDNFPS